MTTALPTHPKIAARHELPALLEPLRRAGRRIVFTNGCFDLLHPGHADLLARARALGDVLVVGVNDDASVRRLKGPTRPVTPLANRLYVLAALACVDFATSFAEDTPAQLIAEVRPDVLVKGGDWAVEAIVGRETVESRGGKVLSLPLLPGHSTTAIIHSILKACSRGD